MEMNKKSLDECFKDWESSFFGFGYGSGEEFILTSLKIFMDCCREKEEGLSPSYDYKELEEKLGKSTAWLLINFFCKHDYVEYGSSSRYAWLTPTGCFLKKYLEKRSVEQLCNILDEYTTECFYDRKETGNTFCQCHLDKREFCDNPFFIDDQDRESIERLNKDPRWSLL
mgnify:CR=1 FL=1